MVHSRKERLPFHGKTFEGGSAEESDSTSEELNAQGEPTTGMVNELVTIVRGTSGRISTAGPANSPKRPVLPRPAGSATHKQQAPRQLPKLDDTF